MNKNDDGQTPFQHGRWLWRVLVTCTFVIIYTFITLFLVSPARAARMPGGNTANPVIRAVDIAKPAVVRIITSIGGRLTVHFSTTQSTTFPQGGGNYTIQLSGSGTFISAHGDILTADHVVKPPHDQQLDQALYTEASQDVADYINQNLNPSIPFTQADAFAYLSNGYFLSSTSYDNPTSKVYQSTDFTGQINATDIKNVPAGISIDVDRIEKESAFDQKDVAIVHVNMDNTPSVGLGDSSNVQQQDELTIIGFPGNGDVSDKDPTTILTSSVNKIYVSAIKKTDAGAPLIQVGGNVEHGDSGGPALDSNGNIVGIVSFGLAAPGDSGSTTFLQASSSANELIQALSLDTKPGTFQKQWTQAFTDYTQTKAGHWHSAQKDMQTLESNFPQFHALQPYLDYATSEAGHEARPQTKAQPKTDYTLLYIVIGVVVVLLLLGLIVYFVIIKGNRRAPTQYAGIAAHGTPQPTTANFGQYGQRAAPLNGNTAGAEQPWQSEPVSTNGQNGPTERIYGAPQQVWQSAAASNPEQKQQTPATPSSPWSPNANNGQVAPPPVQTPGYGGVPATSSPAWPPVQNSGPLQQQRPVQNPAYGGAPQQQPAVQNPTYGAPQPLTPWPPAPNYGAPAQQTPAWPPISNSGPMPQVSEQQPAISFAQWQEQPAPEAGSQARNADYDNNNSTQKLPPRRPQGNNPTDATQIGNTPGPVEKAAYNSWPDVPSKLQHNEANPTGGTNGNDDERTTRG